MDVSIVNGSSVTMTSGGVQDCLLGGVMVVETLCSEGTLLAFLAGMLGSCPRFHGSNSCIEKPCEQRHSQVTKPSKYKIYKNEHTGTLETFSWLWSLFLLYLLSERSGGVGTERGRFSDTGSSSSTEFCPSLDWSKSRRVGRGTNPVIHYV